MRGLELEPIKFLARDVGDLRAAIAACHARKLRSQCLVVRSRHQLT